VQQVKLRKEIILPLQVIGENQGVRRGRKELAWKIPNQAMPKKGLNGKKKKTQRRGENGDIVITFHEAVVKKIQMGHRVGGKKMMEY